MAIFSFGKFIEGTPYKVLDERVMRASAGIMLLLGAIASINGFLLHNYAIIPYFAGFLVANFIIGIFINPNFAPTVLLARLMTIKQDPQYIGAVQKRFAWSLGLGLSVWIFILSLYLQTDPTFFKSVCGLCMICLLLLYLETAFGICVGCKLYTLAIKLRLLKKPEVKPNCMGNSCEV